MIDLVWDGRGRGTITTTAGDRLAVGSTGRLSAADLAASAAAAGLMDAYLDASAEAGVSTLGFVSAADVVYGETGPVVRVRVLIMGAGDVDERRVLAAFDRARRAPALSLFGEHLEVEVEYRALPEACGPC